jgi:Putative Actinobacterial Holin-X, holin superfamily III
MTDSRFTTNQDHGSHAAETTPSSTRSSTPASTPASTSSTRSLGEIVGDITQDLSTLIRQEMDLAKSEMKREVTKLGKGAGMFGGAGATGYLMLIFLSLALVYLLDNWMPVELAALIVALLWGAVTAALALKARQEIKNANPDLPVTQQTLKEDAQWARTQKN